MVIKMSRRVNVAVLLFPPQVDGRHLNCNFLLALEKDEKDCQERLKKEEAVGSHKGGCNSQNAHS